MSAEPVEKKQQCRRLEAAGYSQTDAYRQLEQFDDGLIPMNEIDRLIAEKKQKQPKNR